MHYQGSTTTDLKLQDNTALVTGASQGLGHAIARALAREGVHVAISARRRALLDELAGEIRADGNKPPVIIEADLYDPGAPVAREAAARSALGHIDIPINAAGGSRAIPYDAPVSAWEEGMLVNFFCLRELTHRVVDGMKVHGFGRIVNLTGSSEPRSINVANSAKAAVHAWSKALSREIAKHNITINSLQPGRIISEQSIGIFNTIFP